MANTLKDVINQLEKQKTAIERAIAALRDVGEDTIQQTHQLASQQHAPRKTGRKRRLSAEARKRIAEAQRQRWAAAKKAASKSQAKKSA